MRGTPRSSKSPPSTARAAVSGRIAVPALPKNNLAALLWGAPAKPSIRVLLPLWCTPQPSARKASSMTRVSSESSKSCRVVLPWLRADSRSTRLEMLLEPGSTTVPPTDVKCGMSRNAVENIISGAVPCATWPGSDWPDRSDPPVPRHCCWKSSTPMLAGCAEKSSVATATPHGSTA